MSYENLNNFLLDNNINMLWEIILDDEIVMNKNRDEITQINRIFLNVARQFYDKERNSHQSLIGMNKKFISTIVNILSQNFPKPKPLVIHNNEKAIIPITAEEIQKSRENEFEQEFKRKQDEFTLAMALPVPETPIFSDSARDKPISEMDIIIKRTIAERNLEMQQLTNNFNKSEVENWIKSSETSVRVEKMRENEDANKKIKLSSVMEYDVQSQENSKSKNVSWADDISENNILPGLKLKITEIEREEKKHVSIDEKMDKLEKKVDAIFSMIKNLLLEKK